MPKKQASQSFLQRIVRDWLAPTKGQDWVLEAEWERIQQAPVKAKSMLYIILATIVGLIVWGYFASIDEVARGEGKVVPFQQLQVIQSFDGGIVQELLVKEGDLVEPGQTLIRLDPTRFISNLQENSIQYASLAAREQRLVALTRGIPLQFDDTLVKEVSAVVANEKQLYESNIDELNEIQSGFDNRIAQREQDIEEAKADLNRFGKLLVITQKELNVTKPLLASGAVSEMDILRLERQIIELQGNLKVNKVAIERSTAAINELINTKRESQLNKVNMWNQELTDVLSKMAALEEGQTGLKDVVEQAVIKSPVKGTIQRLLFNTIGGVVTPGSQVIEIIPFDDQLQVEAKIAPKDIAFIRIGQPAILKFSAYDFSVYGGMTAEVDHISADTITNDKDQTFYIVRLHAKNTIGTKSLDILPGMTAQVDIITGKKTILEYIFNPIVKATSLAMSER
ncbi:MAG: HlyD family type I secretion periplasmic adaptor subunit [Aliiglaciecola sp.]|uniref:HlyD family type I secretion periplasmic adaptor subunit n=1 Tax=Aliiglaciecola sp. TaxID=1872441 RepID=UPI003299A00F